MCLPCYSEEGGTSAEQELDLVGVFAGSVREQHGSVGQADGLSPQADGEGGQGEREVGGDGGVDPTGTHGEEKGRLTSWDRWSKGR